MFIISRCFLISLVGGNSSYQLNEGGIGGGEGREGKGGIREGGEEGRGRLKKMQRK